MKLQYPGKDTEFRFLLGSPTNKTRPVNYSDILIPNLARFSFVVL